MNGTNGNEPGYPENALVPYPVIVAATKGDPDAMKIVLQHFSGYIARLSILHHGIPYHDGAGRCQRQTDPEHGGPAGESIRGGYPRQYPWL